MTLVVATYFWSDPARDSQRRGYTFRHEHVHILKSMVSRHLRRPHRFVCVTDDKIDGVTTVPLDWRKHVPGTVFIRLMQHRPDIKDVFGQDVTRILSLDLDVVITSNIDHIAGHPAPFCIWQNPNWPSPGRAFFQSSVQCFEPGARSCLWTDFDPNTSPRWVNWRFGGKEQAWISERLEWNEATFTAADGIYGAGRLGSKGIGSELPENACIVSFPGAREPSQPETQLAHPWIRNWYY
jgi:hypothetical protein